MLQLRLKSARFLVAFTVGALALALTVVSASAPSTADAASSAGHSVRWHKPIHRLAAKYGGFTAVSCAAANMCVAADANGHVLWSTNPGKTSGKYWKLARVDKDRGGITGISCPTKQFCAAVDGSGHVLWSKRPLGGVKRWTKPVRIDPTLSPGGGWAGLSGISCASATLCVAVDNAPNGKVLVSTNPAGGVHTWHRATIASGQLTGVSCASPKLCVATGNETYYSTHVVASAHDWHVALRAPGSGVFSAVSCAQKSSMCLTVGYNSTAPGLASASARASGGKWVTHRIESYPPQPTEGLIDSVSCPTSGFCVALDTGNSAYVTNSPLSGGWSAPHPTRKKSTSISAELSCTVKLCVTVDSRGVITSGGVRG